MFSLHRVINFPCVRPWLTSPLRKMRTVAIPNQSDNYSYLLIDDNTLQAAAVDTFDVQKVNAAADQERVKIVANITTHHHKDHSGGNEVCIISPLISFILSSDIITGRQKFVREIDLWYAGDDKLMSHY